MPDYSVLLARSASKELGKLPTAVARRIIEHLETLAKNPRPARAVKLKGGAELWRVRVGDDRIVYRIDDVTRTVDVSVVRHRRDAYRDL